MKADRPSRESYAHAAWMLNCEVAAIQAVAEVEAGTQGAFLDDGSPVILYEPHIFHRLTGGKYAKAIPQLSYPNWKPGTYGKMSEQHSRLQKAAAFDREAALKSCSWGLFQVLGTNYRRAGFANIQAMVNAAYADVDEHLRMFVQFIINDPAGVLVDALRRGAWTAFAKGYNGKDFARHNYDGRISDAYQRLTRQA